ncbi:MAG: indolepyruvate oxidoreductase subunit beta [Lentimicrobium sp.]|jgi:indolepyruvate ferredoxin oxidoreductase beta subunit|nr:indolepyruvate oxidoreductase subunit beta [Lentimicrobium sp.]MDD2527024.1 indolepyruvate oxidoreductase subunit beta [Lentimicrobiaceae bacterium]MDD4598547.1 indolepyruvate oxidoreductase subunit beta [Lentimicrobiaceae bacterium]HAH58893.1 indolepyruvate oxidoreductase subunit beta [Bacteroidales bacterium]
MKIDIILAGVGGQGILSIAAIIGTAAINKGLYLKQAEVHGMSQRGGDVQSNLRIADYPIASDLIPEGKADMIISVEPMESLRYLPMLSPDGWLVTNTKPYININNYPEMDELLAEIERQPRHIAIDADEMAKELGSARSANMVILGAASPYLGIEYEALKDAIKSIFGRKSEEIVKVNLQALEAGRQAAMRKIIA